MDYLSRILIQQPFITDESYRPCPGTCRTYSAEVSPYSIYICVTSHGLTEHIRNLSLGNSSDLRPAAAGVPFAPTLSHSWVQLRWLQPSLCCYCGTSHPCVTVVLLCSSSMKTFTFSLHDRSLSCLSWEQFCQFKCDYGINSKMI